MILVAARLLLGMLAIAALATGVRATRYVPLVRAEVATGASSSAATHSTESSIDLMRLSQKTTPFRVDRRPPKARYGIVLAPPAPITPPAPKPTLLLTGILWSRDPSAVLEGVPGSDGSVVVRKGQVIGRLEVIGIDSMRVVVRGLDTVWTLTVRNPWR